ncbi:MAG TPA: oligogalacturonate lyase family protein [Acidobacteriaceae bacterium]|jgi:oligogalacturonide lyase|nr:oligogalacturonate lyase family protein [Acidobacteriaceae bacterium]
MSSSSLRRAVFTGCFLLFPLALLAQYREAPRDRRPPDKRPTAEEIAHPPKTWIDKDTGHRVIRLTDEPGSASFYFNVNGYTPDGTEMVYTTPNGISVLNLKTFKTRSVVQGHVHALVVGHKTPSIFYTKPIDGAPQPKTPAEYMRTPQAIYSTNIDTGVTKMLAKVPPHGNVVTINADETLAAGTYEETEHPHDEYRPSTHAATSQTSPLDQPRNKGEMMVRRLAARIPLVLYTLDLTGSGKVTPLLHSTDWINHLLFSPSDPDVLMYCHEGPWQEVDRIWTIHTDGTHNQLMHKRFMAMEIAGHEFWGWNGDRIYYDLQTPKGEDFWLASIDLKTGERDWYHMQRNEWSIHFNVNKDVTLFAGDGGDPGQVAHAPDGEWIYLFHPELIKNTGQTNPDFIHPGVLHAEKLVNMSKHNYTLEPNVSFTPDGKMVIFRSNMFGPTYVFGVEIAKAK